MPDEGPKAGVRLLLRWKALRAFSFPLSVLPVVIAAAAVKPFGEWDLAVLGVSVLGVMLLHGTGNLLNDFFDFRSGVDRRVEGDEKRPGRFLVRGELRPRDVLVEALVCLVLAGGAAGYLVWVRGPEVLWYGLPAVVALYVYTGPPFKLKYRALGEVVVFAAFGPILMAGAAYVQAGEVPLAVILLSIPVGMVTTSVLLGNNLRDAEEDSGAGAKTLVHVVGGGSVKVLYIFFVIVPPIITVRAGADGDGRGARVAGPGGVSGRAVGTQAADSRHRRADGALLCGVHGHGGGRPSHLQVGPLPTPVGWRGAGPGRVGRRARGVARQPSVGAVATGPGAMRLERRVREGTTGARAGLASSGENT
ncbi:MAG: prenyltransferase [Planctomycetota bacterium]|jgi:1,4-dihydroxy-2-naphthoate octaprenyltransferase